MLRFLLCATFCVCLGFLRAAYAQPDCFNPRTLCAYNGSSLEFEGVVAQEPTTELDRARYVVDVTEVRIGEWSESVRGRVLVTTRLYPEFKYGDKAAFNCVVKKPENGIDSTFKYDKYLATMDVWSVCSFPKNIRKFDKDSGWGKRLMVQMYAFKLYVQKKFHSLWPEPEASFMAGILYGSKNGLPPELLDDFSATGVTHIIAVSGFNITIIVSTLLTVLTALGLWRQQAFWIIVGFLILFVLFTGFSASVVRAASMGIITLFAKQVGRASQISGVLAAAAAIMACMNPYVVLWDVGFQLSFLATIGLVYVSPIFEAYGSRVAFFSHLPETVTGTLTQTLAAICATLPSIMYQFGTVSFVAPLVNVLVLWIIPWLMLLGFVAFALNWIPGVGQGVAWLALFGLKYVIMVVTYFGQKSWAQATFHLPFAAMISIYCVLFAYVKKTHTRSSTRQGV